MTETVQYINIVLGIICFLWLAVRTNARWSEYPTEIRQLLVVAIGLIFTLITVSAEEIKAGVSLEYSTIVISMVKLFMLYMLFTTRTTKYRTGTRRSDGNPGADPNTDVR